MIAFAASAFAQLPNTARQLIVAIAPDANAHQAQLQCYERTTEKRPWEMAFAKGWPVLLGRNGLAWGRGVFTVPDKSMPEKIERDGRAPAGVFRLGAVLGYADAPPRGSLWPYVQVSRWDAWIDDPKLPHYNERVRVDPQHVPDWFESQRMRLGDSAYRWLLEIKHNTAPPAAGSGSAIFFHVRRAPDRPTAGCSAMAVDDLEKLIRWLRPDADPVYVLLPKEAYERLRSKWRLP